MPLSSLPSLISQVLFLQTARSRKPHCEEERRIVLDVLQSSIAGLNELEVVSNLSIEKAGVLRVASIC